MKRTILVSWLIGLCSFVGPAIAAEKSVTLTVENMTCASCPYIVKESLSVLPGVKSVVVTEESKTAVVIYDDAQVLPEALIKATVDAGYPSEVKS